MKHNPMLDCALYIGIAVLSFAIGHFSSDDAAKYIAPSELFWLKGGFGAAAALVLAWKMYRSNPAREQALKDADDAKRPEPPKQP
jgi:hypothetical protein